MNKQIIKLFAFIVVLFGVLIAFTSYWSVFDAKALKEKDENARPLIRQQQIERGRILTEDGVVIAKSLPQGPKGERTYVRRYPEGPLYAHPIGYSFVQEGDFEFEQFHNKTLIGEGSEFASILDEITGATQKGNDIVTNIDSEAQAVAQAELEAAGFGAVVAIEPKTGRVRVMASNATYNPNRIPDELDELNRNDLETPLVDRASQGTLPAGIDLQGGDRRGGAGKRRDHAGDDDRRARHDRSRRQPPLQRLQRGLLRHRPRHRADQLGQHLVRAARRRGRLRHAVRTDAQVRLRLDPADRPAFQPARHQRRQGRKRKHPRPRRRGRRRPRLDRPGAVAGDARCRWRWWPPRSPTRAS